MATASRFINKALYYYQSVDTVEYTIGLIELPKGDFTIRNINCPFADNASFYATAGAYTGYSPTFRLYMLGAGRAPIFQFLNPAATFGYSLDGSAIANSAALAAFAFIAPDSDAGPGMAKNILTAGAAGNYPSAVIPQAPCPVLAGFFSGVAPFEANNLEIPFKAGQFNYLITLIQAYPNYPPSPSVSPNPVMSGRATLSFNIYE